MSEQEGEPGFNKVVWKRCLDLNDRQLREVETGLSNEKNIVSRRDKFDITVASEVMAIVCLAKDMNDLKRRSAETVSGSGKGSREKKEGLSDRFSETDRNKRNFK